MIVFRVKNSGYDSPRDTLTVLEEDPNIGQKAVKTSFTETPIDAASSG